MAKNSAQRAEERARRREKADQAAAKAARRKVAHGPVPKDTKPKPKSERSVPRENVRTKSVAPPTDPRTGGGLAQPRNPVNPAALRLVAQLSGVHRQGGPSSPLAPPVAPPPVAAARTGVPNIFSPGGLVGLARGLGLGGGGGAPALSPVEQYIASLPAVERSSYLAPFDQAESAARAAHGAALPDIESTYRTLTGQLAAGNADAQQQLGRNREDLVAQLARTQAELAGFAAQGQANPHVTDPTLQAGFQGEMATRQAAATQSADQRVALADRFSQIQQQSADARTQDAGLAQSAALSNASTNLQQILGAIGVKRAGAEAAYNNDSAQRAADVFKIRQDAETQAAENAKTEATAAADAATAEEKARKAATSTPSKLWKSGGENAVRQQYPRGYAAYREILDGDPELKIKAVAGSGARAMNEALQRLEKLAPALKADGLNVAKIRQWIEMTYDDWSEVDTRG